MRQCGVPQGSVLWALSLLIRKRFTLQVLFDRQIGYHLFADDKQVYVSVLSSHEVAGCWQLADTISNLQSWCASHRLLFNAAKTELIWFGSRAAFRLAMWFEICLRFGIKWLCLGKHLCFGTEIWLVICPSGQLSLVVSSW